MVLEDENKCILCNRLEPCSYVVSELGGYYVCSKDLSELEDLEGFYLTLQDIWSRYAPLIPRQEIPYILDGLMKPKRVKSFIIELINLGLLKEHGMSYLSLTKRL